MGGRSLLRRGQRDTVPGSLLPTGHLFVAAFSWSEVKDCEGYHWSGRKILRCRMRGFTTPLWASVVGLLAIFSGFACATSDQQEAGGRERTPMATATQGIEGSSATMVPSKAPESGADTSGTPSTTIAQPSTPTQEMQDGSTATVPTGPAATATPTIARTGGDATVATPSSEPYHGPLIWLRPRSSPGPTGTSVIVKFVDGMTIRLSEAGLVSLGPQDVEAVRAVFARHPISDVAPVFTQPVAELEQERRRSEEAMGRSLPDLTLFFRLTLEAHADAASLVADLVGLDIVENAYIVPPPEPPPAPGPGG